VSEEIHDEAVEKLAAELIDVIRTRMAILYERNEWKPWSDTDPSSKETARELARWILARDAAAYQDGIDLGALCTGGKDMVELIDLRKAILYIAQTLGRRTGECPKCPSCGFEALEASATAWSAVDQYKLLEWSSQHRKE